MVLTWSISFCRSVSPGPTGSNLAFSAFSVYTNAFLANLNARNHTNNIMQNSQDSTRPSERLEALRFKSTAQTQRSDIRTQVCLSYAETYDFHDSD
jgi:hypothetical protein